MVVETEVDEQVAVIDLDEYQELSKRTALYPKTNNAVYYPAMGLAGEAGEVMNEVKKVLRDDHDVVTDERRATLKKELGDVLWYLAQTASALDLSLSEIASANLTKLFSRQKRGVLTGSGNNR